MRCAGGYCDDLYLTCVRAGATDARDCDQDGWLSEENGGYNRLPDGKVVISIFCNGRFCDNKILTGCNLVPR